MTVPPEKIEPGKCYLMETGHVRRVTRMGLRGRIQYMQRMGHQLKNWQTGAQESRSFASIVQHEVPCDWTPEADGA